MVAAPLPELPITRPNRMIECGVDLVAWPDLRKLPGRLPMHARRSASALRSRRRAAEDTAAEVKQSIVGALFVLAGSVAGPAAELFGDALAPQMPSASTSPTPTPTRTRPLRRIATTASPPARRFCSHQVLLFRSAS